MTLNPLTPNATNAGTIGSSSMSFDIIPLVSDFSVERNDPHLPCHMMPPHSRNRAFFGRTEVLKSIRTTLWPQSHGPADSGSNETTLRTFALCGPGGIGKTQVATEFVHTSKDKYDAIFWLQADERSKLSQGYSNIAIKLGLVLEDSADARDPLVAQDLVKAWLANPLKTYKQVEGENVEEAKWLLIFDNVDDPDILDDFWPLDYAGAGAVLITSRDPLAKTYIYSEESGVTLPPFTTDEATDFLLKLTRREGDDVERVSGSAVAERLGGLPLAITQMAGVIDRRELSFSEFLNVFEEEDTRESLFKMQVGSTKTRSGYQHTLDTVWALEKLGASSAILLEILSLLDPDGIPETILESKISNTELCDYPQTEIAYHEARTVLLQSSLIARDRIARRITIHRLVQDGARSKMTSQRFSLVFNLAVNLLSAVWPFESFSFGHGVSRWAQCAELFPHVIQLQRFSSWLKPGISVAEASLQFPKLLGDAGRYVKLHSNIYNVDY
jgi:NB-ARC domain